MAAPLQGRREDLIHQLICRKDADFAGTESLFIFSLVADQMIKAVKVVGVATIIVINLIYTSSGVPKRAKYPLLPKHDVTAKIIDL